MKNINGMVQNSKGDIEAMVLYENKEAFASIINKNLYSVLGEKPDCQVSFHHEVALDLFCIRVQEFLAERKVETQNFNETFSIFSGAKWFANEYRHEIETNHFNQAIASVEEWLKVKNDFSLWSGTKHINFSLTRKKMLRYAGLLSKHNLFSINGIINDLHQSCKPEPTTVSLQEILEILDVFKEELGSRIRCLATSLIELLHIYFTKLTQVIYNLYGSSDISKDKESCPPGMSDSFWHMHWTTVTFSKSYDREHYNSLRPYTSEYLKQRY